MGMCFILGKKYRKWITPPLRITAHFRQFIKMNAVRTPQIRKMLAEIRCFYQITTLFNLNNVSLNNS